MNKDNRRSVGFWRGIARQFRLAWRLLWDPRVPAWTKLVPAMALLYIFSPIDFMPDWIVGLGQLDDVGIMLLGVRVFTELIPDNIVLQHLEAMGVDVGRWRVEEEHSHAIDAEYEIRED
jgi:uncharacterized membrane protein YkvA (DUF1232 family)